MKSKFYIDSLSDHGDVIEVKAQGTFGRGQGHAQYLATFKVPHHLARRYQIGEALSVEIKPARKSP